MIDDYEWRNMDGDGGGEIVADNDSRPNICLEGEPRFPG